MIKKKTIEYNENQYQNILKDYKMIKFKNKNKFNKMNFKFILSFMVIPVLMKNKNNIILINNMLKNLHLKY